MRGDFSSSYTTHFSFDAVSQLSIHMMVGVMMVISRFDSSLPGASTVRRSTAQPAPPTSRQASSRDVIQSTSESLQV